MTTKRILSLAAVASLAAVSTIATTTWLGADAAPSEVRLHLATNGQRFTYGSAVQQITVGKNSCEISAPTAPALINLTSTGSRSRPGLANYGLGVKESPSSGNGSPCAQIASTESLTITPGPGLGGRQFTGLRLDLEMTGDAVVVITLTGSTASQTYRLQTGTSITVPPTDTSPPYQVASDPSRLTVSCAAPNSSGPNSAGNDNCEWTVLPGFVFDTVTLTTTKGTASLEGGGDFGTGPEHDTLFYVSGASPVAAPDTGDVDQNRSDIAEKNSVVIPVLANDTDADLDQLQVESLTQPAHGVAAITSDGTAIEYTPDDGFVGPDSFTYRATDGTSSSNEATVSVDVVEVMCSLDTVSDTDAGVQATFTRLSDPEACKRYTLDADAAAGTVLFQPQGGADVDYRGFITFGPKAAPVGTLGLLLQYDPELDGTYKPVRWCTSPVFDAAGNVTSATRPSGETWCIASETTRGQGTGNLVTTWQVFGRDDPKFQ
jgi:hypothetical protein